jgi:hypothetical protein
MPLSTALALLSALLLLPLAARAQTYVEFFEIPGNPALHGLDVHDGFLWAAVRSSTEPRLLQIDPADGSVVGTVPLGGDFTPLGVTWDGTNVRVSESFTSSPEVFTVSPAGEVIGQIPAPSQLSNGLAFHDGTLFVAKAYPDDEAAIVGVDPATGDVTETIAFPSTQPGGIAFLGDGTFWTTNVGDDSGSDLEVLWQIDRATGEVLDTLNVPTEAGRPRGLAYDGSRFLYAVMDEPGGFDDVIYKIDLATEGTPVYADDVDVLDFGVVDSSLPVVGTVTITNEGDGPLEIGAQTVEDPVGVSLVSDGEPFTLAPGESAPVEVSALAFDYGPLSGTLTFTTNDVANETVAIPITGFGVIAEPDVGVAEDAHDFGEVRIENPYDGAMRSQVLWPLRIIGTGDLDPTVTGITITGDAEAFSIPDLTYPLSIATMDTLTVFVAFAPPAVGGYTATLTLATDNPNEPTIDVTLTGEGIDPTIEGGDALWTLAVPDNPNTSFDDRKVTHLAAAGDLTGDGKADLIVGTENYLVFAVNGNGWGTGDILWSFNTCKSNSNCGAISGVDGAFETSLAANADLDGDGVPDVVFSTDGGNDHVYALSGADGSVIWEVGSDGDPYLAPYYSVAARFDATGDGVPDVVTGTGTASEQSPDPFNNRRVYSLDGATGAQLWERSTGLPVFATEQIQFADGTVLAVAGGATEFDRFVTAWTADAGDFAWTHTPETTPFVFVPYPLDDGGEDLLYTGGSETGNRVVRLDGETGEVAWERTVSPLGWSVAVTDDLNGNGSADIAVGLSSGDLWVYDGADGETVWVANGFAQVFGVAALGDVTDDGTADLAAATGDGRALLLSGADGSVVWGYGIGNGSIDQAAEVVAVVPDLDGNGAPEIAVGARHGQLALLASTGAILTDAESDTTPTAFGLDASYPNPFSTSTTIRYTLPKAADARLTVYDLLGRRVRTLVAETQAAGTYRAVWDGRDAAGGPAASGVYLYRLEAGDVAEARRLTLIR